jgi:hypothetical protein
MLPYHLFTGKPPTPRHRAVTQTSREPRRETRKHEERPDRRLFVTVTVSTTCLRRAQNIAFCAAGSVVAQRGGVIAAAGQA